MHTLSVVIATRNRQALLAETLEALAAQDWPADAFEIIVADNGSTDVDTAGGRGRDPPAWILPFAICLCRSPASRPL